MRSLRVLLAAVVGTVTPGGASGLPRWSWDTVLPFFHSSNKTGDYNDEAIRTMARFPLVTIEKWQGTCANANDPYPAPGACHEEAAIAGTLARVKAVDPNVSTIFYYNSVLNYLQYDLAARFYADDGALLLRDANGSLVTEAGGGNPNVTVFDFAQPAAAAAWADACVNATLSGAADGCFVDRAVDPQGFETNGQLSPDAAAAWAAAHQETIRALQARLGADAPLIANHAYNLTGVNAAMIESFSANLASIELMQTCAQNGKLVVAHANAINNDTVAAFLIGAGPYAYIGFGPWTSNAKTIESSWVSEFYDAPLGAPLGAPRKDGDLYTRAFARGTAVTFNTTSNEGTIVWGAAAPTAPARRAA